MAQPTVLDLKVPPALVVLLTGGGMWGLTRAFPALGLEWPMAVTLVLGITFGAVGVGLALAGVATFRRHGTTVDPLHPEAAGQVVRSGPFRRTRNPMYLGMALLLLGWALGLAHPLAFLGVPVLMAYLTRFQIQPEERALRAKFGAPYEAYLLEVRRWL